MWRVPASERTRNERQWSPARGSPARNETAAPGARLIANEVLEAEAAEKLERR
jgi:hypothetical protein